MRDKPTRTRGTVTGQAELPRIDGFREEVDWVEANYPSESPSQYSSDASASASTMEGNGHKSRPRLSRILLSFSLVLLRLYEKSQPVFLTREARLQSVIRGAVYGTLWFGISGGLFWLGAEGGMPYDLRTFYPAHRVLLLVRLAANMAWVSAIVLPLFPAFIFINRLVLRRQGTGEIRSSGSPGPLSESIGPSNSSLQRSRR